MAREYGTGSVSAQEAELIRAENEKRNTKRSRMVKTAICVAFILIGGLSLLSGFQRKQALPYREAEVDARIDLAMQEYSEIEELYNSNDGKTVVHVQPEMSSAAVAGQAVCDAQNELIILYNAYRERLSEDKETRLTDEHVAQLENYNVWMDAEYRNNGMREPWTIKGHWFFGNTYEYRGRGAHQVVWICYSQNTVYSPIIAVATASYNPTTAKFSSLNVYKLAAYYTDEVSTQPYSYSGNPDVAPAPPDQTNDPVANPPKEPDVRIEENGSADVNADGGES